VIQRLPQSQFLLLETFEAQFVSCFNGRAAELHRNDPESCQESKTGKKIGSKTGRLILKL
jgi:hypothetical protein